VALAKLAPGAPAAAAGCAADAAGFLLLADVVDVLASEIRGRRLQISLVERSEANALLRRLAGGHGADLALRAGACAVVMGDAAGGGDERVGAAVLAGRARSWLSIRKV